MCIRCGSPARKDIVYTLRDTPIRPLGVSRRPLTLAPGECTTERMDDKVLGFLVMLANGLPAKEGDKGDPLTASVSLTLVVSGAVVSGRLISAKEYASAIGVNFASAFVETAKGVPGPPLSGHSAIDLAAAFDKFGDVAADGFLHLKDASIWSGHESIGPGTEGALWRVRISDVSAFVMGTPTAK